jgi:hypothetical protein
VQAFPSLHLVPFVTDDQALRLVAIWHDWQLLLGLLAPFA